MQVTVRLFAALRERAGTDSLTLDLPEGARAGDARDAAARRAGLADVVARVPVALAVNRRYARAADPLTDGDELALIPPVSGG